MFGIRRIYDEVVPANREAIEQVQRILRRQFTGAPEEDIEQMGARISNPFGRGLQTVLYVAESRRKVAGFAVVLRETEIGFCYLEYIASDVDVTSRGVGGALYERIRDDAVTFGAKGLFFECLPDTVEGGAPPSEIKQNQARLKFYERYDARPIIGTDYERPLSPGQTGLPHLIWDGLDRGEPLRRDHLKQVVRAILERKYRDLCPPEYVKAVLSSIKKDPVEIRAPRYGAPKVKSHSGRDHHMSVIVNDKHDIHHVRERGYVESPVRITHIIGELEKSGLARRVEAKTHSMKGIEAVHEKGFVDYLRRVCAGVPEGKSLYPYVFPIRNAARPPKELSVRAGYYCIDTFTPLNQNAFLAAKRAVDCALTGAELLLQGERVAYALVRPPGHHAERRTFGGFCYFNNNAVAAHYLSKLGRVAILDVDYHHGNGQQDIFYNRADVLTVSIHGHPNFAYPYFSGFADEVGEGEGEGANLNLPQPENVDGTRYRKQLTLALDAIQKFDPAFLVVALGLDTARGDPTGTWTLAPKDFTENGSMIGALGLPTLVVQEGGYRTRTLGTNARSFFEGLVAAAERV